MKDLAARFEQKTGNKVDLSFGASGNFYSQIQNGAPFDLFFSADLDYAKKLAEAGKIESASVRTYAVGHLVLWVPKSSKLDPQKLKMDLLLDPSVQKIAIANPEHAPYGRAAMAALEHYGLKDKVAGKLVLGENISQAAQFVQSGNAQAGLIALSLAMSPAMKNAGKYWELPQDAYPEIQQGVGILTTSKNKQAAQAFIDYISSPEGTAVLEQYGFRVPSQQMILQALTLTLRLALTVSAILLIVGIPLAYWLAYSQQALEVFRRGRSSRCPSCCRRRCSASMFWSRSGRSVPWAGGISRSSGHPLAFTFEGLVVGSVLYSLPFAVQPMATSFAAIDRKLLDASALLGASRWRTFRRIVLPLGLPGVLTGFVLELCAYVGRVRRGADDRRQHSWRDPHYLHSDIRPGRGARLRRRQSHCAAASGALLCDPGRAVWLA